MSRPPIVSMLNDWSKTCPPRRRRQRMTIPDKMRVLYLISQNYSAEAIAREVGCSEPWVHKFQHRLHDHPAVALHGLEHLILLEAPDGQLQCCFCGCLRPGGKERRKAVMHLLSHVTETDRLVRLKVALTEPG